MRAARTPIRQYLDPRRVFDPRRPAGRLSYFLGCLYVNVLLLLGLLVLPHAETGEGLLALLSTSLGILLSIRRLLDLGHPSWWVIPQYIPLVGLLLSLHLLIAHGRSASYFLGSGDVFLDAGDYNRALAYCDRAVELDPSDPRAHTNRGRAYGRIADRRCALADLDRATRQERFGIDCPTESGGVRGLAAEYGRADALQEGSEARSLFSEVYRPAQGGDLVDYQRAIADFGKAIELDASNGRVWYYRGICYRSLGNHTAACTDLHRALALDPSNTEAFLSLAMSHILAGDCERVINDCRYATLNDPDNARIYADLQRFALHPQSMHECQDQ